MFLIVFWGILWYRYLEIVIYTCYIVLVPGRYTKLFLCLNLTHIEPFNLGNLWEGSLSLTLSLLYDPLRLLGTPPLGWTSSIPKKWVFPTKLIVVGYPVVTHIWIYSLGLWHKYKSCDNSLNPFGNIWTFRVDNFKFYTRGVVETPCFFTNEDLQTMWFQHEGKVTYYTCMWRGSLVSNIRCILPIWKSQEGGDMR